MRRVFSAVAAEKYAVFSMMQPISGFRSAIQNMVGVDPYRTSMNPRPSLQPISEKQKGRSTLAGSALILSDSEQFDDVDTARIHFSGRSRIWTLQA
ncbi:hypothetical protein CO666_08355 [Rhizobium chutanense]|uniref:Uncharacterized protein n=1 Tax=Rhizobium chutanense TaxID=2035448 RepID=A0A2A6JEF7_9HYPH|nr:hypothetical protein [Rhizobium chutanense]PDT04746.1 hypothetical protein CO666_08355 [Rhizobium chutanense]